MKKIFLVTLACMIAGCLATTLWAQTPKVEPAQAPPAKGLVDSGKELVGKVAPSAKPAAAQKGKGGQFAGVVEKVEGRVVTVKGAGGSKAFDLSAANLNNYEDVGQIKAGDTVQVLYKESEGKAMASSFQKTLAGKAAKPAPAKPVPEKVVPATPVPAKPAPEKVVPPKPTEPAAK
jgi:hypothetical protein